jgi:hypothetical protein
MALTRRRTIQGRGGQGEDRVDDRVRDLLLDQNPAERRRGRDDEHHLDRLPGRLPEHPGDVGGAQLAVDDEAEEHRVEGGEHGGFGRREHAAEDPADDEDRHDERGQGADEDPERLAGGRPPGRTGRFCGGRPARSRS